MSGKFTRASRLSLPEQVERMFAGTPSARDRASFREQLVEFERLAGSGRKAAKLVGIGETSWRRWKAGGTRPKEANLAKFGAADRASRSRRIDQSQVKVDFTQKERKRPARDRQVDAKALRMGPGAADRIYDAFVSGGSAAGAAQLVAEVKDPWYQASFLAAVDEGDGGGGEYGLMF